MRRKLKNLKNKGGHSENGSPRALIDLATYREIQNMRNVFVNAGSDPGDPAPLFESRYSGWSNASRPKDSPIFLRGLVLENRD